MILLLLINVVFLKTCRTNERDVNKLNLKYGQVHKNTTNLVQFLPLPFGSNALCNIDVYCLKMTALKKRVESKNG